MVQEIFTATFMITVCVGVTASRNIACLRVVSIVYTLCKSLQARVHTRESLYTHGSVVTRLVYSPTKTC